MTKPLSPAAQAVMDAAINVAESPDAEAIAAAVLRAAVDQVVPATREHYPATIDERYRKVSAFDVRNQFFAIATELKSQ